MALVRMLMIAAAVSLAGGVFCALIGGLVGYAFPSAGTVYYGAERKQRMDGKERDPNSSNKVEFGVESERNLAAQGAAIGGALGLTLGALVGCVLGVLDQVLHLVRGAVKGSGGKPAGSPGTPTGPPKTVQL